MTCVQNRGSFCLSFLKVCIIKSIFKGLGQSPNKFVSVLQIQPKTNKYTLDENQRSTFYKSFPKRNLQKRYITFMKKLKSEGLKMKALNLPSRENLQLVPSLSIHDALQNKLYATRGYKMVAFLFIFLMIPSSFQFIISHLICKFL